MNEYITSTIGTAIAPAALTAQQIREYLLDDEQGENFTVEITQIGTQQHLYLRTCAARDPHALATWLAERGVTGTLLIAPDFDDISSTWALRLAEGKVLESTGTRLVVTFPDGSTIDLD